VAQKAIKSRSVFKTLHDNAPLRIEAATGVSRRLVVSFTSVGTKRNKPGMARKTATVFSDYILEHGITNISAIGTSMGAYNALVLGKLIPFTHIVAFAPQYSVHPDIVPEETRWKWFRKQIENWPHRAVEKLPKPPTQIVAFHGDTADEKWHWARFPEVSNLRHFIFSGADHNFVVTLKQHKVLLKIVQAVFQEKPLRLRKLVGRLGGMTRAAYAGFEAAMLYFEGRRKLPRPAGI